MSVSSIRCYEKRPCSMEFKNVRLIAFKLQIQFRSLNQVIQELSNIKLGIHNSHCSSFGSWSGFKHPIKPKNTILGIGGISYMFHMRYLFSSLIPIFVWFIPVEFISCSLKCNTLWSLKLPDMNNIYITRKSCAQKRWVLTRGI